VDELAVAHVDADVAEGAAHGVEEHQVTGLELAAFDGLCGRGLLVGSARQQLADGLLVDGAHKAAAIEPCFVAVAAPLVRHAQEGQGVDDEAGGLVAGGGAGLLHLLAQPRHEALVVEQAVHVLPAVAGRGVRRGSTGQQEEGQATLHGARG
jgi:hypothetical protein